MSKKLSKKELTDGLIQSYEELRQLTVEILQVSIYQHEKKLDKQVTEDLLFNLANRHIDIETKISKYQKLIKEYENDKLQKNLD